MRCFILSLVAVVVPFAGAPVHAQSQSSQIGGKTLKQWTREILDADPGVRENAIRTVILFGKDAQEAVPSLITELSDQDTSLRVNAAIALGLIGLGPNERDVQKGVDGLKRLLFDSQTIVRFQAATALGRIGKDGRPAIANLVVAIGDRDSWEVRKAAAFALGSTAGSKDGPDARAVRALTTTLHDYCAQVRLEAVMSLIFLGPPQKEQDRNTLVGALTYLFSDKDKPVAIWARVAVMRMGKVASEHLAAIAVLLKSPDALTRVQALRAFMMIGPEAKSRLSDVIEALDDRDPTVTVWAMSALVEIGRDDQPPSRRILAPLQKIADNHKEAAIKAAAKEAIAALTKKDEPPKKPVKKEAP
jgi:HEAT repeat protein